MGVGEAKMWSLRSALLGRSKQRGSAADGVDNIPPGEAQPPRTRSPQHLLAPTDLEVSDVGPKQVLLIGACFLFEWGDALQRLGYSDVTMDRLLFFNLVRLPASPPKPVETYDVQLVQIPLTSVMPEQEYTRLPVDDPRPYEALLDACVGRLDLFLAEALVWSNRIPTFVMTYLSPQQNLLGRLLPRYDLRNPIHFTERLNIELDGLLKQYRNVYLLDTNHIASVYGRRFMQEDAFWHQHHGGLLSTTADELWDGGRRIEKSPPVAEVLGAAVDGFVGMVWQELRAAYRTLRRADEVKMLCVDLDDTLWRGLIGEWDGNDRGWKLAGWPHGLLETLQYLKRRGVILAIVSKNDETHVRGVWHKMFDEGLLRLEDFAIVKINWRPKAENIAEAMAEANILPKSVVFLDDNPVERSAVKAAFPEIRTLETSHFRWSRVLGWSPELQVAEISGESARRTQLIQAQVERQQVRAALSREDFLASLNLRIAVHTLRAVTDSRFARAFELLNKTNQFNTTGVRWLEGDAVAYFERGGVWWTFEVVDRFTNYGLVGLVCMNGTQVDQFVMSCRVAGLEAELAALSVILGQAARVGAEFDGFVKETKNNAVSRDIFARLGWSQVGSSSESSAATPAQLNQPVWTLAGNLAVAAATVPPADGERWRGPAPNALPTHVTLLQPVPQS
jgi:FkbH-like protein